jgi:23S rRNA G2445 N2-methylase RlmL
MDVQGWDVNAKCIAGATANLDSMYGRTIKNRHELQVRESSTAVAGIEAKDANQPKQQPIDCLVSNLPWGLNSVRYEDEHDRILAATRGLLRPGAPCALI